MIKNVNFSVKGREEAGRRRGGRAGAQSCSRMEQFDQLLTCCICLDR